MKQLFCVYKFKFVTIKKMVQCLTQKKSHCSFFTIHLNLTSVTEPLYAFVGLFCLLVYVSRQDQ